MVPGASLVLDLRVHGDRITGTGAYSIEAGRAGTLQIDGAYSNPGVAITIVYDYGPSAVFSGTVSASQDIDGDDHLPPGATGESHLLPTMSLATPNRGPAA